MPSLVDSLPASAAYPQAIHTVRGYLLHISMSSILVGPEINACHHSVYRWKTNSADSGKWCIKCGVRDCIRNSINNICIKYIHILHIIQRVQGHAGIKGG